MGNIIANFLMDFIKSIGELVNFNLEKLVHNTLYIEDSWGLAGDQSFSFDVVMGYIMGFAIVLIILKFLKKGFDAYVAWTDDPSSDPVNLAAGLVKALVVALSFPILYGWITDIIEEFTAGLLNAVGAGSLGTDIVDMISSILVSKGLAVIVAYVIYIVLYIILYIKFLMRGGELLILRLGFPIACVGMIDANGGIFTGYLTKLFQTVLSVTVQVVLARLSLSLMIMNHCIWAIAFMILAIKSPQVLREMIYSPMGGSGLSTMYYTTNMLRGLIKK